MEPELRPADADEVRDFFRCTEAAFGARPGEAALRRLGAAFEADRSLVAVADGEMVATATAYSLELTVPGGALTPAAGVASVGVLSSHRRRGILTRIMRRQIDDVRNRGEPLALLTASEGSIYGRFGYGPATFEASVRLERRRAGLARPLPCGGSMSLVEPGEAVELVAGIHDRARATQPGDVSRPVPWWDDVLGEGEPGSDPDGPVFVVVHSGEDGATDGYAAYRYRRLSGGRADARVVSVLELRGERTDVTAALWGFVCDLDLSESIEAAHRPVDDPLRWLLADSRQARLTDVSDHIWARLVDVEAALATRRYAVEGELVLAVADSACPWNAGGWLVAGGPDGAAVTRAPVARADLALDVSELASAYLGGVRLATLARAGRVVEERAGAAARADSLFRSDPAPFCATSF